MNEKGISRLLAMSMTLGAGSEYVDYYLCSDEKLLNISSIDKKGEDYHIKFNSLASYSMQDIFRVREKGVTQVQATENIPKDICSGLSAAI